MLCTHETRDPVASSWATQHLSQSWTTIGLATAKELLSDALAQTQVLYFPRSRLPSSPAPIIIAAA